MVRRYRIDHALHVIWFFLFPVLFLVWFAMSIWDDIRGQQYARIFVDDYGVVSVRYSKFSPRNSLRSRVGSWLDLILVPVAVVLAVVLAVVIISLVVYLLHLFASWSME